MSEFPNNLLGNWKLYIYFGNTTHTHHMEVTKVIPQDQYTHDGSVAFFAYGWPEDNPEIKWRMDPVSLRPDGHVNDGVYIRPLNSDHAYFHLLLETFNPGSLTVEGRAHAESYTWPGSGTCKLQHL